MPYDEDLADRVRAEVCRADRPAQRFEEKRMFGGLAFLVDGHMTVAVSGRGGLMVRAAPELSAGVVDGVHVEPMRMRGRDLTGWLYVTGEGLDDLGRWVDLGLATVATLPSGHADR